MPRRLIPLALACALIAGCTTPESRLDLDSTDTGTEFLYVAEDYDLYPVRRPEGEAWRAQELRARLADLGICGEGYRIERRDETLKPGRFFSDDVFSVTYHGQCAATVQIDTHEPPTLAPMTGDPATSLPAPGAPMTHAPVTEQPLTEQPLTDDPLRGELVTDEPIPPLQQDGQ